MFSISTLTAALIGLSAITTPITLHIMYRSMKRSLKKRHKHSNGITGNGNAGNQWKGRNLTYNNFVPPARELTPHEQSYKEMAETALLQVREKTELVNRLLDKIERQDEVISGLTNEVLSMKYDRLSFPVITIKEEKAA